MRVTRAAVVGGVLLIAAGLALGGAVALGWHRSPPREVEIGALATPLTTDPTATDDAVVSAVLLGTVYPTVASLATTTADGSGYVLRLRGNAPVSADQVAGALSRSRGSGSPRVRAALDAVDTGVPSGRSHRADRAVPPGCEPAARAGRRGRRGRACRAAGRTASRSSRPAAR